MKTNNHSGFPFKHVVDHDDAMVIVKAGIQKADTFQKEKFNYVLWYQVKPGHYKIIERSPILSQVRCHLDHHKKVA